MVLERLVSWVQCGRGHQVVSIKKNMAVSSYAPFSVAAIDCPNMEQSMHA